MNNKEIINILKEDIKELKQKGFNKYKIIEGLNTFGFYEVDLMVYINEGLAGFNKSIRTIKFKSKISREKFLKDCKEGGL